MKKSPLILSLFLLVSCGGTSSSTSEIISPSTQIDPITTIMPTGAPTLCFYDKGADVTNYNFTYDSTQIKAEIITNHSYDALVMDATTALKLIKANNSPYKFAKLLTGGNTYLVSINKDASYGLPKAGDKVVGFQEKQIPGIIYNKLAKDYWHLSDEVVTSWVDNVSLVAPVLKTGKYGGEDVDFVYIAEPALTAAIEGLSNRTIVSNVRSDWKAYSGLDYFPQAGLFVKEDSYTTKKSLFDTYFSELDSRINTVLTDMDKVVSTLYEYGTKDMITSRFGINPDIVKSVQTNNGLGIVSNTVTYGQEQINAFLSAIGDSTRYGSEYFLSR